MNAKKGGKKDLELRFWELWATHAQQYPLPQRHYRFDKSRRHIDFAWAEARIGVEIQGGVWNAGKHGRGAGIVAGYKKNNDLAALGWRILYFDSSLLRADGKHCVELVITAILFSDENLPTAAKTPQTD